jgi:hypothetical protein
LMIAREIADWQVPAVIETLPLFCVVGSLERGFVNESGCG